MSVDSTVAGAIFSFELFADLGRRELRKFPEDAEVFGGCIFDEAIADDDAEGLGAGVVEVASALGVGVVGREL